MNANPTKNLSEGLRRVRLVLLRISDSVRCLSYRMYLALRLLGQVFRACGSLEFLVSFEGHSIQYTVSTLYNTSYLGRYLGGGQSTLSRMQYYSVPYSVLRIYATKRCAIDRSLCGKLQPNDFHVGFVVRENSPNQKPYL